MSANERSNSDRLNNARELLEKLARDESTNNIDAETSPNKKIDNKLSNKQKKAKQRLRNKAIYYLSLREYSYQELKQKLKIGAVRDCETRYSNNKEPVQDDAFNSDNEAFSFKKPDAEIELEISLDWLYLAIDEVVDDFKARSLLSDARFTEQMVHARKAKFGSCRIAHELKQKGVEDALICAAIANVKTDEFANALDICRKKYKSTPQTREEWAKQARFLQSRGFGFDVIKKVLNQNIQDE